MSNVGAGVYANGGTDTYSALSLNIRLDPEIAKRAGVKHGSKVGVKLYETKSGKFKVAVRPKPDKDKGFRPIKAFKGCNGTSHTLYLRLGVTKLFSQAAMENAHYSFANNTLYVDLPW